ncbi:MAG: L-dopachrome tautomerase-related protein [Bacteroidota bacterium]
MRAIGNIIKWSVIFLLVFIGSVAIFLRLGFGGGKEYEDISSAPRYGKEQLELFFSYDEPIGNVAATNDTAYQSRVFFTIHPESRPENYKLVEIVDNKAIPYPNEEAQNELFNTVLGVYCDQQNRLWTIDHGLHASQDVKLTAFDLKTDEVVHEYVFPGKVAEFLSFFNDLSVTPDGRYVFVADVSFFGKTPSLVVYDTKTGESRSLLDSHESVTDEGYVPVTPAKKMRFFGGIVDLLTGIDGIEVSPDGKYVYYAAMGHSTLYRIPVASCIDFDKSKKDIEQDVESLAQKPLSDGIRCDQKGWIYITDIENQGIFVVDPAMKEGFTLIKDDRIRWADGLALASDGYFYLADSDIPNQMLQSKKHMAKHAPYNIFRFKPLN